MWKNSTFNMNILFKTTVLTGYYCSQLRTQLEKFVGEQTNPAHTVKSPATDIHTLAYVLSKEGISWSQMVRREGFVALDYLSEGADRIMKSKRIEMFNAVAVRVQDTLPAVQSTNSDDEDAEFGVGTCVGEEGL